MPTYNGAKYLQQQLDSIYAQTMVPDEVIVVDDCSTDGTLDILKEYHEKYGLKYYENEHNLGYNKNFEKAIRLCSGDYIALSDQDDYWMPEKIEVSYQYISKYPKGEPSLVSSFSINADEKLKPFPGIYHDSQGGDWRLNLTRYNSQGCTLMMNRALVERILPIPDDIIYDAYIGLTAAMTGNRYYINQDLMLYRLYGNNSLATDKPASPFDFKSRWKRLRAYMPFWYDKDSQYKFLHIIQKYQEQYFIPERVEVMNKVIRIFEVGKLKRLFLFLSLDGPDFYLKAKVSISLVLKMIFFIKDEY